MSGDIASSGDLPGRLKTITDPKDQVTTHSYNVDDSLSGTVYTNAVIATPSVSYAYDPSYARVATMVDGIGTTSYTYKAAGTNGAGQVATVDGPLTNDTIAYAYDQLGRVIQRTINGTANQVDWTFDALGHFTPFRACQRWLMRTTTSAAQCGQQQPGRIRSRLSRMDSSGNATTKTYEVSVTGSTKTFAYDADVLCSRYLCWRSRNS